VWLLSAVLIATGCTESDNPAGMPPATSPIRPPAASAAVPSARATSEATATEPAEVAALLARPMRLATVPPGAACPVSPVTVRSPVAQAGDASGLGTGPLYPITLYTGADATLRRGGQTPDPSGRYELKVVWASTSGYRGPAVVRVGRLDGPGRGAVRLSYEPAASRGDAVVFTLTGVPKDWPAATLVSGPGCFAYQIDGLTFTEIIVFRVV
jgi:hypothetical protein